MAIPQPIADIIKLAKEQEVSEGALEALKAKKTELVDALALINSQITTQTEVVQSARASLKVAAGKI